MDVRKLVFWDVDTQNDFMNANGALYVPNAETIKPLLKEITNFADEKELPHIKSLDWHSESDPEMIKNGGPFPFHCMASTKGAEPIDETRTHGRTIFVYPNEKNPSIFKIIIANEYKVSPVIQSRSMKFDVVKKQHYDVFTQEMAMKRVCDIFKNYTIVIFGVATDYCVKAAALGFKQRGIDVIVIEDAIMGVAKETTDRAIQEMIATGIIFKSWDDLHFMKWNNADHQWIYIK